MPESALGVAVSAEPGVVVVVGSDDMDRVNPVDEIDLVT